MVAAPVVSSKAVPSKTSPRTEAIRHTGHCAPAPTGVRLPMSIVPVASKRSLPFVSTNSSGTGSARADSAGFTGPATSPTARVGVPELLSNSNLFA